MVEAYNIGDGSLSLSLTSSVSWIATSIGPSRACTTTLAAGNCLPLQFTFSTSGLEAGVHTGIVSVAAGAGTIDAPQTITVTVRVGGVDAHVAPGASREFAITTNRAVTTRAATGDGGSWLSLTLDGTGSFRFVYPYRIRLAPPAGMSPGTYNGSVTTSGSSVAGENVTIPVTMRVTTEPIAQPSVDELNLRLAEAAPPLLYPFSPLVTVTNIGEGTLNVAGLTTGGGAWLKPDAVPGFVAIDPTGLSPGSTIPPGSVTIASNAVNGPPPIPVNLQIVAKGAPLIYYQGVLDNGTFVPGDTVAQGDVMVIKGEQLSFSPFTPGPAPPLAAQLGGATVRVNGDVAPLFYSSYGQLAFQMPVDTPLGTALVEVERDGQRSNTVSVDVAARAPRLLAVVNPDGSINTADGSHPASPGDVLVIYAIGLGPTSPEVATGAPAPSTEPLARVTGQVLVSFGSTIGGAVVAPAFAGLTPTYAGLYQLNVFVPDNAPKGLTDLSVAYSDARSNLLRIAIR